MYERFLTRALAATSRSVLLLGLRQVGKATLLAALRPDLTVNLASPAAFRDYVGGRSGVRAAESGSVVASARRDFFAMPLQRNVKIVTDPLQITMSSIHRISPMMLTGHDAELSGQDGECQRDCGSLLVAR